MSKNKIKSVVEKILESESNTISIAIIEGAKDLVYSTDNWDISRDIRKFNSEWATRKDGRFELSGTNYVVLQATPERLVAVNIGKKKEGIIGFKDEEREIVCKVNFEVYNPEADDDVMGEIAQGLTQTSKSLRSLSSRKPYMDFDVPLGKTEAIKWATPRILLDDTTNLQEIGLIKFGLSIEEAKVYLALLESGIEGEKVGKLNEVLDIKRTTIYRILDRLIDKEWIVKMPARAKAAQIYIARPLNNIMDERITQKEEELMILKSTRYIMGEELINGWIHVSDIDKDQKESEKEGFDFKTIGITGVDKDCGILIFEYFSNIENDIIIKAALQLSSQRFKLNLQLPKDFDKKKPRFANPDLDEVKFEDIKFQDYLGVKMNLQFKKGSKTANNLGKDYIEFVKQVAIPIEDKIYVLWGTEEKFEDLIKIIKKL